MAKLIFMAMARGISWVFVGSFFVAFIYFVSIYLNPENRTGLVQGLICGTSVYFVFLLNHNSEQRFFKKFWHGKFWLPFSVSTLIILAWTVMAWSFLVKLPYSQQKHEGSPLMSVVGIIGAMTLLLIVELCISRWLRLRAQKKKIVDAICGPAVKRTEKK